ncbi:hypothetical protein BAUCODRAFT_27346 [Baudoinia panamericana UAMH 10762]|uniref:Uncharacterized protein n=1 Tax=Baudoinia panamericana (strain UAMH 10762) TaxID=717646 RepID=M2N252_BAUPA|nr:uncharacterized protein BAUCODRAFT_27346 [Baudoinia panamericana UAMH 10762]EMC93059.1 hypothetical protein BAUCODRAFT_27346 [Baudoinia panamericana UAMH 10762]
MSSPGYWPASPAFGETLQNVAWHSGGQAWGPNVEPKRTFPVETPYITWLPDRKGWYQGRERLRNFTPNYYFTRPHDGKRPGFVGRLTDALKGEGGDVFVTSSGDKRTLLRDRPQRWEWGGWGLNPYELWEKRTFDRDWRPQDEMKAVNHPFTAGRKSVPLYNFKSRQFESEQEVRKHPWEVWTNAQWPQRGERGGSAAWNVRDLNGQWWSRIHPSARIYPGARPRP